ncbi:MAG: hypothetical protein HS101_15835 [Planctomycetia bacterium]|nr:hypothetical protein [Planctomycetia bacterium]MCC7315183.1 hypothetical protein [Planctomycetota bacterium]
MTVRKRLGSVAAFVACGIVVIGACDALRSLNNNVGGIPVPDTSGTVGTSISQGRDNASRLINTAVGNFLFFDLRQFTGAGTQNRCNPLGTGGIDPWPSRIGGPVIITPNLFNSPSEYDWVARIGETEYCLALRVPVEPFFPLQFSQVEFSLRAVNPVANGHLLVAPPGNDYFLTQADFPSNDDIAANRSLIDTTGGDVALIVSGIDFIGSPTSTVATMNFLGPTGWLVFMRDNAFRSGRFFNITGALKGGPPAFFDTPGTADDGFFESVQVNGDNFDSFSEPFANTTLFPTALTCAGGAPTPGRTYSFVDLSNLNEILAPGPGQGGGIFIIRREAFIGTGVVVNPNVPGPAPAPVAIGDLIVPPFSGYNETIIPAITANGPYTETDNSFNGPGGVHEIGWSIFFVHGS